MLKKYRYPTHVKADALAPRAVIFALGGPTAPSGAVNPPGENVTARGKSAAFKRAL